MPGLKNHQKKLFTAELATKVMEYFIGLDKKNESLMRCMVEKKTAKLVKEYYDFTKAQQKKLIQAQDSGQINLQSIVAVSPEIIEPASLNAI